MKLKNLLLMVAAIAVVGSSAIINAPVVHGKITLPDCSTVSNPQPGVNCTQTTTSGGSGSGSGSGTTTTTDTTLSVNRQTPDDGTTANAYIDVIFLLSVCSGSIPPINIYLSSTAYGSQLVGQITTVDPSTCKASYRVYLTPGYTINGNGINNGLYTITASGTGYKTTSTNFNVAHHGTLTINNSTGALTAPLNGDGSTDVSACSGSGTCNVPFSNATGLVVVQSSANLNYSVSDNWLTRFASKLIHMARAASSTNATMSPAQTTTVNITTKPCTVNVTLPSNDGAVTGDVAYHVNDGSSTVYTSASGGSFTGIDGLTYQFTDYSSYGTSVNGNKVYKGSGSTLSLVCSASVTNTLNINYLTRAKLQVK